MAIGRQVRSAFENSFGVPNRRFQAEGEILVMDNVGPFLIENYIRRPWRQQLSSLRNGAILLRVG